MLLINARPQWHTFKFPGGFLAKSLERRSYTVYNCVAAIFIKNRLMSFFMNAITICIGFFLGVFYLLWWLMLDIGRGNYYSLVFAWLPIETTTYQHLPMTERPINHCKCHFLQNYDFLPIILFQLQFFRKFFLEFISVLCSISLLPLFAVF